MAAERNQTHELPDATAHADLPRDEQANRSESIDVNVATAEEIDALPALKGHGFEIVRYREERGRFDALRQLEEVPGLKGKVAGLDGMVRFD